MLRPRNSKYDHVQATVDTGISVSRYLRTLEVLKRGTKTEEIFDRMKISTFVTLVLQVAKIKLEEAIVLRAVEKEAECGQKVDLSDFKTSAVDRELLKNGIRTTEHATLQSVIVGVGESDFQTEGQRDKAREMLSQRRLMDAECPYLLLDVRSEDEFKQSHIITAQNYPYTLLSRAQNYETKVMIAYKNQPGKVIIVYDDAEKYSPRVASTLLQRGYDNIYLLSGGMKFAYTRYPDGLFTGMLPTGVVEGVTTRRPSREYTSSVLNRSSSMPTSLNNTGSKVKAREVETQAVKDQFTTEDLDKLRAQLEKNLLPTISRRLSRDTSSSRQRADATKAEQDKRPAWTSKF